MTKPMLPRWKQTKRIDETGKRYGKLVVLEFSHTSLSQQTYWKCRCDCGMFHIASGGNLRFGGTHSCGCKCGSLPLNGPVRDWSSKWSRAVRERDNYTCARCKRQDKNNTDAHHIYGAQEFPEKREDINNGITLCIPCHKKFHKYYGRFNFTPEDLEKWINTMSDDEPTYHGWAGRSEKGVFITASKSEPQPPPMPLEVLRAKLAELRAARAT